MVLVPDRAGAAVVPVTLPPAAESLTLSYGVNPELWMVGTGDPVSFSVRVRDPSGEILREWGTAPIDPRTSVADRRWFPVRVDLEGLGGRRVRLEFETRPAGSGEPRGGFKDLRLISSGAPS